MLRRALAAGVLLLLSGCGGSDGPGTPTPATDFTIRRIVDTGGPEMSVRLVRDPVSGALLVLQRAGDVFRLTVPAQGAPTLERLYRAVDTGVSDVQGMAFAPDGTLYIVGNQTSGLDNFATIRRGARTSGDQRVWTTFAQTVPYPRSNTAFDHQWNGIVVSPDGRFVYLSSGSRTDHGEVQTSGGRFPGLREVPLTAKIFRLPATASGVVLLDDEAFLTGSGYVFARGVRNSFDPAFNAAGDLFSGDNSGDRDDNDELNWLREGGHYGFPWRMGTNDTPQQQPGYDPEADKLVDHRFYAYQNGFFHDDPTYPPRPSVPLLDPIPNLGTDASQDLLFLDLQRTSTGYEVRAQSVVCGFLNPIDTEILNGRLYVLEFGGAGTVWEITTPEGEPVGRRPCANVPR